jgi:methyl-accepting chemotaxis protein
MNISALSVRARLLVGFGAVCALLLVIVTLGLYSMRKIDHGVEVLVNETIPKIDAISTLVNQTDTVAIALRNMMLTQDAADRQKQLDGIQQASVIADKNIELLDKLVVFPKGKQLLQDTKNQRARYQVGYKALTTLIMADKPDEARTYLNGQLRPVLGDYKKSVAVLMEFHRELLEATAKSTDETYFEARTALIALGVLALALAGLLGTLITRSLMRELGGEPRDAAELARAVAAGDFTHAVSVRAGDTQSLMASLVTMQGNLAQVVTTVRQGSEGVATASAEIAQGNNDLSARTEQQASALEETAASMEELGSTVKQNADSARTANQLAQSASSVAVQGGKVVDQVVETMKGINESSRKISDIISVIDGIAFQTNILALNAAVEAARAGEQGRGFAVVASEVRSLAGRSADAAKEIKMLINASVERVEHGTALVDQAGTTMTEVVDSIRRVTDIMGEISAASSEQSMGVQQVGEAVTQMDQATQQNAALVEQMAAAASSLKSQAQELVQVVSAFKVEGVSTAARHASAPTHRPVSRPVSRPAPTPPRLASASQPKLKPKAAALPKPVAVARAKPTPAGGDDDWETF